MMVYKSHSDFEDTTSHQNSIELDMVVRIQPEVTIERKLKVYWQSQSTSVSLVIAMSRRASLGTQLGYRKIPTQKCHILLTTVTREMVTKILTVSFERDFERERFLYLPYFVTFFY